MIKSTFAMKGFMAVAVLAATLAVLPMSTASAAPTAQEVIDKYIEAIGGKAAVEAQTSRSMVGVFSLIDMGMTANMEIHNQPPNSITIVSLEGMGEVRSGIKDGVAWEAHFMNGDSILEGDRKADAIKNAELNEFLVWEKYNSGAEVTGEGDVGGEACWMVEMTPNTGSPATLAFSQESGLLLQRDGVGPDGMPSTSTLSDYKDVGGVLYPHMMSTAGMMTVEITFESITVNEDIPAETFDYPASIAALTGAGDEGGEDEGSESKE